MPKQHRILFATDGSPSAQAALATAAKFPWPPASRAQAVVARTSWLPALSEQARAASSRGAGRKRSSCSSTSRQATHFTATMIVLGLRAQVEALRAKLSQTQPNPIP